jgi:hypothetical protein
MIPEFIDQGFPSLKACIAHLSPGMAIKSQRYSAWVILTIIAQKTTVI